jgi:rhodanese-related sulfurtransferase
VTTPIKDVSPAEAWQALSTDPTAKLVDVRTAPEWNFVGAPDLSGIGKQAIQLQWQVYPTMQVDPEFLDKLRAKGAEPGDKLYFLCRSGVRSVAAAKMATEFGFRDSINIVDGFEGPADAAGHRGTIGGWKHAGLPWRQG